MTSIEFDKKTSTQEYGSQDEALTDFGEYQRLIGRLLYLTMMRTDISFVVQTLSQFMYSPKQSHLEATRRVVRYIKSAPRQGLLLPSTSDGSLTAYCGADWGACIQTRRSGIRYPVFYGDAMVSWKSKK